MSSGRLSPEKEVGLQILNFVFHNGPWKTETRGVDWPTPLPNASVLRELQGPPGRSG